MISDFYNFKLLEENDNTQLNIGDYVIVKFDLTEVYSKNTSMPLWHNIYGIIIDSGHFNYEKTEIDNLSLVSILCELTDEQKVFIKNEQNSDADVVSHFNTSIKGYDSWFHNDYLLKFNNKDEFDKEVEKIELEKAANKYNL